MRYLFPVTLAAFVGLSACSDLNQPVIGDNSSFRPGSAPDPQMRALFEEAWRSAPAKRNSAGVVGVLGVDPTVGTALVVFVQKDSGDIYEYRYFEGRWIKGRLVESRPLRSDSNTQGLSIYANMDWNGAVGQLFDGADHVVNVLWSPAPWAGY